MSIRLLTGTGRTGRLKRLNAGSQTQLTSTLRNGNSIIRSHLIQRRLGILRRTASLTARMKGLPITRIHRILPDSRSTTIKKLRLTNSRFRRNQLTQTKITCRRSRLTDMSISISALRNQLIKLNKMSRQSILRQSSKHTTDISQPHINLNNSKNGHHNRTHLIH